MGYPVMEYRFSARKNKPRPTRDENNDSNEYDPSKSVNSRHEWKNLTEPKSEITND